MSDDLTVLVVDDDFMVAKVHERFVERTPGFVVVGSARTGRDALDLVESLAPDLVLLDVHLPDISGLEVLAALRSAGRQVGVLMVTAERGADAVRSALLGGAMQYLVKPFEYDDLATRLRQVAASLGEIVRHDDPVDQQAIDRVFGRAGGAPAALPKGLSTQTADLVRTALSEQGELSASEAAELVGLSRVSARRYLEHFADTGVAEVRLQYGTAGRPERRYRPS